MKLDNLAQMFNRSVEQIFDLRKFFLIFFALLFSGMLFIAFQGIAFYVSYWWKLPLLAFPLFVLGVLLMASGAMTIKIYSRQKGGEIVSFKKMLVSSQDLLLRAVYFMLPLLVAFLALWAMLGFFILFKSIPYLGTVLGIIFAFAPFLINVSLILLFIAVFLTLFYFTPLIALEPTVEKKSLFARLQTDIFTHLLHVVSAFFPIWIVWLVIIKAARLTFEIYSVDDTVIEIVLQSFFILIPICAILALPFVFFFNFTLEAYQATVPHDDKAP